MNAIPANSFLLECDINVLGENGIEMPKSLAGYADVFVVPISEENAENADELADINMFHAVSCVNVIELKSPMKLSHSAITQYKNQLISETLAVGNLKKKDDSNKTVTMSLLTDLFAISACVRIGDDYFVSPRVVDERAYLVRILFALCTFTEIELLEIFKNASTIAVKDDKHNENNLKQTSDMSNSANKIENINNKVTTTKKVDTKTCAKEDRNNNKHSKNSMYFNEMKFTKKNNDAYAYVYLCESALHSRNNSYFYKEKLWS